MRVKKKTIGLVIYLILLLLPIYWMLSMSLRSNADILASFALYPKDLTFMNYMKIFTDSTWYMGYVNSFIYVAMNTVISLFVALPAAYAFSRYKFVGDKQMFFWLLTNRMAPAAVFALPFFGALLWQRKLCRARTMLMLTAGVVVTVLLQPITSGGRVA